MSALECRVRMTMETTTPSFAGYSLRSVASSLSFLELWELPSRTTVDCSVFLGVGACETINGLILAVVGLVGLALES
jgi:hypothetical protein